MINSYPLVSKYFICATDNTYNKKWRRIVINGTVTNYEMNKDGILRNHTTKRINKGRLVKNGYLKHSLTLTENNHVELSNHRLLCCLFMPIPKKYINKGYTQEYLEVNHKDGDKHHNELSNLEWCTRNENQIHALNNGLSHARGEESHFSNYTNKEIIRVCELLEQSVHPKEISKLTGVSLNTIWLISTKRAWVHISENYDLTNAKDMFNKKHSDDIVHNICKLLTTTDLRYAKIGKIYGVTSSMVYDINRGRLHKNIVTQYDLPRHK